MSLLRAGGSSLILGEVYQDGVDRGEKHYLLILKHLLFNTFVLSCSGRGIPTAAVRRLLLRPLLPPGTRFGTGGTSGTGGTGREAGGSGGH